MHERFFELCPRCHRVRLLNPSDFFCTACGHRLRQDDGRPVHRLPRSGDAIALAFRRRAPAPSPHCLWCRAPLRPALRFCTACGRDTAGRGRPVGIPTRNVCE